MRGIRLAAALAAAGLLFAACGDDGGSSSGESTTTAAGGATTTAAGATTTAGTGECKPGTVKSDPMPDLKADGKGKSIGLLFDVTGRGDKSFNDAAAAALDKAKKDFGVTGVESTPTAADGSDRPERIKSMVGKNELVVAVG
ncbi:MAG TPA: hypothetical protein VF855_11330, partial [Acidimicrobiales bacterium]